MSIFYSLVHLPMSSLEINLEKVEPETAHHDKKSFEPPKCCTQFGQKVRWQSEIEDVHMTMLLRGYSCMIQIARFREQRWTQRAQCPQLQSITPHILSAAEFPQSCSLCSPQCFPMNCVVLPQRLWQVCSSSCVGIFYPLLSISGFSTHSTFSNFRT